MVRLSKTEKDKIEALYKCQRAILEQDIQDKLSIMLRAGIKEKVKELKELEARINVITMEIEDYKKENGYQNMDRYGCMRAHPKIDKFRAETNAQLMKLWGNEATTLPA